MAGKIDVNIVQSEDGLYSATIKQFPGVAARNAKSLDELRFALEQAISRSTNVDTGKPVGPIKLPDFIPGQTTTLTPPQ